MAKGLGVDIIEIRRIKKVIDQFGKKFLNRLFTTTEQVYCLSHKNAPQHFAGRFAAKEAVAKALGTGIGTKLRWVDIEIENDQQGKPGVKLSTLASHDHQHPEFLLSISHSKDYAIAVAFKL